MKFKVTELFGGYGQDQATIQGEGRFVGTPSVFLRLFGCNLECRGFGMDEGATGDPLHTGEPEQIEKMIKIYPDKYKTLNDLPLATTGCDSYSSWHKGFKSFSKDYELDDLVKAISKLVPNGFGYNAHLVITGGEPLLPGQQKKYPQLLSELWEKCGLTRVTFETNGTQVITEEFQQWVAYQAPSNMKFYFSCSVKLSCSGEKKSDRINPAAIDSYVDFIYNNSQSLDDMWFKFVASREKDFDEIDRLLAEDFSTFSHLQTYVMPVGGTKEELDKYEMFVVGECLNRGYSYSPRMHVNVFGNSWGK